MKEKVFCFCGDGKSSKATLSDLLFLARISQLGALFIRASCLIDFAFSALLLLRFEGARTHRMVEFAARWQSFREIEQIADDPTQAHGGLSTSHEHWPSSDFPSRDMETGGKLF